MLGEDNARTAWLCTDDPGTKRHALIDEDDILERAGIDVGKMGTEDWREVGSVTCLDLGELEVAKAIGALKVEGKDGAAHGLERMLKGLRELRAD